MLYDKNLVYDNLAEFDKCMNEYEVKFGSKIKDHQFVTLADEEKKLIVFEKGDLLYIFNFHHTESYSDFVVGTNWPSDHFVLYDTEEERFMGLQRLNGSHNRWYNTHTEEVHERPFSLKLYIPSRSAIVLCS